MHALIQGTLDAVNKHTRFPEQPLGMSITLGAHHIDTFATMLHCANNTASRGWGEHAHRGDGGVGKPGLHSRHPAGEHAAKAIGIEGRPEDDVYLVLEGDRDLVPAHVGHRCSKEAKIHFVIAP